MSSRSKLVHYQYGYITILYNIDQAYVCFLSLCRLTFISVDGDRHISVPLFELRP